MPAVKYSQNYENIIPKTGTSNKQSYQSLPVKKERTGNIKKKKISVQSKITALNFTLLSLCGVLTLAFIAIYSVVALSETKIANLHSKIHDLNYENVELENKLENIKSYYSVDTKVASSAIFEKAKNVLELNHLDAKEVYHAKPSNSHLKSVTGF